MHFDYYPLENSLTKTFNYIKRFYGLLMFCFGFRVSGTLFFSFSFFLFLRRVSGTLCGALYSGIAK